MKRLKINISGRVQGVGFRPTVYRYAVRENLTGFVLNTTAGIVIEVEGKDKNIKNFSRKLKSYPPGQSKITKITFKKIPQEFSEKFVIKKSVFNKTASLHIAPDISICDNCIKELFDKKDRRYLYPFINCTNCGPRFSIIKNIPYDRKNTTMRKFEMCVNCTKEYKNPVDRRFHTQPDACWNCGPDVKLVQGRGTRDEGRGKKAIEKTIKLLKHGEIVAVKGIGGFHIVCDAANEKVVKRLRLLKNRPDKPFAVMIPDIKTVKNFCHVSKKEEQILHSPERPIVLLRKKTPISSPQANLLGYLVSPVSKFVAPSNNYLGVMLPYTPLHYLLFQPPTANRQPLTVLIMTSGNRQDEPVCKDNNEAIKKLSEICNYFLIHNRNIYNRCDDSIVRVDNRNDLTIIRRSRGYIPNPIQLSLSFSASWRTRPSSLIPRPSVLALGAELKNTFCLTRGNEAYISQYIGDLKDFKTYGFYKKAIEKMKNLLKVKPEVIAYDMHPDYFSTRYAKFLTSRFATGEPTRPSSLVPHPSSLPIQHHHAHIASVCAENNINEKIIGVAFDGTGYGTDRNIWGGEFLIAESGGTFRRKYHLKYIKLPGGDAASDEIWRIGFSYLYSVFGKDVIRHFRTNVRKMVVKKMIDKNVNCPLTSSVGRLFDAVASIINLRQETTYEAQAAIEMEQIAGLSPKSLIGDGRYDYEIIGDEIDVRKMIIGIIADLKKKRTKTEISLKFHNMLSKIILDVCQKLKKETRIKKVALSGGVFQNMILLRKAIKLLKNSGFDVFINNKVPANDGGISLGQTWVAHRLLPRI